MAQKKNFVMQLYHADDRKRRLWLEYRKYAAKADNWLRSMNPLAPKGLRVMKLSQGTFLLDDSSFVDRRLITRGIWEEHQLDRMAQAFRSSTTLEDAVFLDIGAYWGLYAILAKKAGIPEVHVFEPDPRNRAQLHAQFCSSIT